MTTPFYKQVLKNAWLITWKNKFLWLFGFFATFIFSGVYEIFIKGSGQLTQGWALQKIFSAIDFFSAFSWTNIKISALQSPGQLVKSIFISLILIGLTILIIWLAVISQTALIKATDILDRNKKTKLKDSFVSSYPYFWNILGLNVLGKIIIFILLLLFGLPLFIKSSFWSTLLFIILFIAIVSLSLIISFMVIYASAFVILKKKEFLPAIKESWNLFRKNWLFSLEMALVLFVINILAGFGLGLFLIIAAVPFVLLSIIFYLLSLKVLLGIILVVTFFALLFLTIVYSSILTCFQVSAWTLTFNRLADKGAVSKILEWLSRLIKRLK